MIKIGVIGGGKIAEKHLNAYKNLQNVEISISDTDENKKEISKRYNVRWQDDPKSLLSDRQLDAIDVCVPTPFHAGIILKAIENGKHVFCEKPLARSLEEATNIKKAIEKSNSVIMVGYLYRFHPAFQFAKEIIQEEIIGTPYYALLRLGGRGSHKVWKHKKDEGGGANNEMLVHMLDLITWYFGEPVTVKNLVNETILRDRKIENETIKPDVEDIVLIQMNMKQGATVLCESDLITPSYMNYIEMHGDNGSYWTSILDYFPTIVYCKEPRGIYDRGHNFFEFPKVNLFEKELAYFIENIQNGTSPSLNSIEDSIKIMEIIENTRIE